MTSRNNDTINIVFSIYSGLLVASAVIAGITIPEYNLWGSLTLISCILALLIFPIGLYIKQKRGESFGTDSHFSPYFFINIVVFPLLILAIVGASITRNVWLIIFTVAAFILRLYPIIIQMVRKPSMLQPSYIFYTTGFQIYGGEATKGSKTKKGSKTTRIPGGMKMNGTSFQTQPQSVELSTSSKKRNQ